MKIQIRHTLAWLGLITGAALVAAPALAADPLQSITASPSSAELSLDAGSSSSGSVKITNTGQTSYGFTVSASPFSVSGENYDQSFAARPDLVDASKWFSFPDVTFTAVPGEVVPVDYRLKVPADAAPGGYYAVMFAETKTPASSTQGITGRKRVGVLFYLTVNGSAQTGGSLVDFNVPLVHTSSPLKTTTRVQNTGNVHFEAVESVEISDVFGNTKARLDETHIVFPKSTRKVELNWSKAPAFGIFKVSGTVRFLGETHKLPTRYTLMLSATAFVVMFIAVVLIVGYWLLTRKRRSNVVRRRR